MANALHHLASALPIPLAFRNVSVRRPNPATSCPSKRCMRSVSMSLLIAVFSLFALSFPTLIDAAVLSNRPSFHNLKKYSQPSFSSSLSSSRSSSTSLSTLNKASTSPRDLNTEAAAVSDTFYVRITSSSPGCPSSIDHGQVVDRDDLPPGIHGVLSYDSILVNGQECTVDADDDEMHISSFAYIENNEDLGNIANLSGQAVDSIFVAALDLAPRECGDYSDAFLNQYYFVEDLRPLYADLIDQGLLVPDDANGEPAITDQQLADERDWLVSLPQTKRDPFRICVFKKDGLTPSPSPSGSPSTSTSDDTESSPIPEENEEDENESEEEEEDSSGNDDSPDIETEPVQPPQNSTFGEASNAANSSPGEDDSNRACFPATATVRLASGAVKRMDDITVGDLVQVSTLRRTVASHSDDVEHHFSPVFFFSHRQFAGYYPFVQLETHDNRSLVVSPSHYVYLTRGLVPARSVRIGDSLISDTGVAAAVVTSISYTRREGLFNPHTTHGDIVVDGFHTSCYTEAIRPYTAHAFLAPLRAVFSRFHVTTDFLHRGHPSFLSPLLSLLS